MKNESRIAIDVFTTLAPVTFQMPQVVGPDDLIRLLLRLLHDLVKFQLQSNVKESASDGFFRPRPSGFVLVGIPVLGRRCAAHVLILRGDILSLARVRFLELRWLHSLQQIAHVSPVSAHPF